MSDEKKSMQHLTKNALKQGLHLIAILPDREFRFSRANNHDLIRLERFTPSIIKDPHHSHVWYLSSTELLCHVSLMSQMVYQRLA